MELVESYRGGQPIAKIKQDENAKPITSRREKKQTNMKRKLTVLKEEMEDESDKNEESKSVSIEIGFEDDSI